MKRARDVTAWGALALAMAVPVAIAATSPQLQWRSAIYIAASFAGVVGLSLLLVQPLLAGRALPGLTARRALRWHGVVGALLLVAIAVHVGGLYLTSPPDVVDALLLRSPTRFSLFGVAAMWAAIAAALVIAMRRRIGLRASTVQRIHLSLALIVVGGTVVHALLIIGTMGWWSKLAICTLVVAASGWLVVSRARCGRAGR